MSPSRLSKGAVHVRRWRRRRDLQCRGQRKGVRERGGWIGEATAPRKAVARMTRSLPDQGSCAKPAALRIGDEPGDHWVHTVSWLENFVTAEFRACISRHVNSSLIREVSYCILLIKYSMRKHKTRFKAQEQFRKELLWQVQFLSIIGEGKEYCKRP